MTDVLRPEFQLLLRPSQVPAKARFVGPVPRDSVVRPATENSRIDGELSGTVVAADVHDERLEEIVGVLSDGDRAGGPHHGAIGRAAVADVIRPLPDV